MPSKKRSSRKHLKDKIQKLRSKLENQARNEPLKRDAEAFTSERVHVVRGWVSPSILEAIVHRSDDKVLVDIRINEHPSARNLQEYLYTIRDGRLSNVDSECVTSQAAEAPVMHSSYCGWTSRFGSQHSACDTFVLRVRDKERTHEFVLPDDQERVNRYFASLVEPSLAKRSRKQKKPSR